MSVEFIEFQFRNARKNRNIPSKTVLIILTIINEPDKRNVVGRCCNTLETFRVHLTPHTSLSLEIVIRAYGEIVCFYSSSSNAKAALEKIISSSSGKTLRSHPRHCFRHRFSIGSSQINSRASLLRMDSFFRYLEFSNLKRHVRKYTRIDKKIIEEVSSGEANPLANNTSNSTPASLRPTMEATQSIFCALLRAKISHGDTMKTDTEKAR